MGTPPFAFLQGWSILRHTKSAQLDLYDVKQSGPFHDPIGRCAMASPSPGCFPTPLVLTPHCCPPACMLLYNSLDHSEHSMILTCIVRSIAGKSTEAGTPTTNKMTTQAASGMRHAAKVLPRPPPLPCVPLIEPHISPSPDRICDARGHSIAGIFNVFTRACAKEMSEQAVVGMRQVAKVRPHMSPLVPCTPCRAAWRLLFVRCESGR